MGKHISRRSFWWPDHHDWIAVWAHMSVKCSVTVSLKWRFKLYSRKSNSQERIIYWVLILCGESSWPLIIWQLISCHLESNGLDRAKSKDEIWCVCSTVLKSSKPSWQLDFLFGDSKTTSHHWRDSLSLDSLWWCGEMIWQANDDVAGHRWVVNDDMATNMADDVLDDMGNLRCHCRTVMTWRLIVG